jgi:hypothetical protein
MRVIIIEDKDAKVLLQQLEFQSMYEKDLLRRKISDATDISKMHRKFHYIVCKWLQEQGARV